MDNAGNLGDAWTVNPVTRKVSLDDASPYVWEELAGWLKQP